MDNKLYKYLLYAVGEVILVIIGILIAVSLNNANEARKQELKIKKTLAQAQEELKSTIFNCAQALSFCAKTDSLARVILTKSPSKADFRNDSELGFYVRRQGFFTMENDGYSNFVLLANDMPEKYESILSKLNNIHKGLWPFLEKGQQTFNDMIDGYESELLANHEWAGDFMQGRLSDEAIDFMRSDFRYRNMVSGILESSGWDISQYAIRLRIEALDSFREIDKLLEQTPDSSLQFNQYMLDSRQYEQWIGKYEFAGNEFEITAGDSTLLMQNTSIGAKPEKIYPVSDRLFHTRTSMARILLTGDSTKRGIYIPNSLEEFFLQKQFE